MKLYDSRPSGNCYKIRLLLSHLGLEYDSVEVSMADRTVPRPEEMLRDNPHGRVPLLVLDDGRTLPESNAILGYLARGTQYSSDDPYDGAQILRWMFFEQNSLEPSLAVSRYLISILGLADRYAGLLERLHETGRHALTVMDRHLERHDFFPADGYTIADIALYAYSHVGPEGGFDLEPYPRLRAWHRRVESQPGFVPMNPES